MATAHHHQQALIAQCFKVIGLAVAGNATPGNGQVNAALVQQAQQLVACIAHDAQAQLRALCFHVGHSGHHQVRRRTHDGADRQVAIAALAAHRQILGAAVQAVERGLGKAHQLQTQRGRAHAARQALKQLAAKHVFNLAQHARGSGLRHRQADGCAVQVQARSQCNQHVQVPVAQAVEQAAVQRWCSR